MEKPDIIYQFAVLALATLVFFMKITAKTGSPFFNLMLKLIGKAVPLYCILFSGVQIFKYFGILR